MDRENEDLRPQPGEARRDRESDDAFARATPTASSERVEAVRMGAGIVRANILEASNLRNVRRGSAPTEDNERHLTREGVPATATKILEDTDGGGVWSQYGLRL